MIYKQTQTERVVAPLRLQHFNKPTEPCGAVSAILGQNDLNSYITGVFTALMDCTH